MRPPVRRLVTRHDEAAKARFAADRDLDFQPVAGGQAGFALVWTTDRSPADNLGETDGALRPVGLAQAGGSVLRVVDFRPGSRSPMHRTCSMDYGIVLEGELVLELDSGEERAIGPGDIVVQRGTNHAWVNRGEAWARMVFVLLDAERIVIDGEALGDIHAAG